MIPLPSQSSMSNLHIRFAVAFVLNFVLTLIQIAYAWKTASVSLLSDAIHNLSDIFGLLMAWGAQFLLHYTRFSSRYTYGYKKATILSAFIHALLLFLSIGFFAYEAIEMLAANKPMDEIPVILVAAVSILVNGGTACLFLQSKDQDVNIKATFLHLALDALTSLGVLVSAVLIYYTQYSWIDAIMALLISGLIMVSSGRLMRDAFRLILDAVPSTLNLGEIEAYLKQIPGVISIHQVHIWAISTQEVALTAHIVMAQSEVGEVNYSQIYEALSKEFKIQKVTLQIEPPQALCAFQS